MAELTKWIGKTPLTSLVDSLRPAQKADFEKLLSDFESNGGLKPKPSVYLRNERPVDGNEGTSITLGNQETVSLIGNDTVVSVSSSTTDIGNDNDEGREYVEAIDLTKKLKGTEYATHLTSDKWEPQLKAMQLIIDTLTPVSKIEKGCDLSEIVQTIKTNMRQGHITVQIASMKVIGLLADGARNEFSGLARSISQMIILRCKEKKLCPELTSALKMILTHCLGFESFFEDFNEQIRSKKIAVHGRLCLLEFIVMVVNDFPSKISTESLKPLVDLIIFACDDSDPKIRDVCTSMLVCLGPLIKSRGKSALDAHKVLTGLEQKNPRAYKKIKAAMDGPSESSINTSTSTSIATSTQETQGTSSSISSGAATKKTSKQTMASTTSVPASKKTAGAASSNNHNSDDTDDLNEDFSLSLESAIEQLGGLCIEGWNDKVQELIKSAKWQGIYHYNTIVSCIHIYIYMYIYIFVYF